MKNANSYRTLTFSICSTQILTKSTIFSFTAKVFKRECYYPHWQDGETKARESKTFTNISQLGTGGAPLIAKQYCPLLHTSHFSFLNLK